MSFPASHTPFLHIEMRKKLKRYGIEIKTCWEMPEASKAIARTAATGPVAVSLAIHGRPGSFAVRHVSVEPASLITIHGGRSRYGLIGNRRKVKYLASRLRIVRHARSNESIESPPRPLLGH